MQGLLTNVALTRDETVMQKILNGGIAQFEVLINKCLYKLKYGYFKNEVPSEQLPEPDHLSMHIKNNENQTEP